MSLLTSHSSTNLVIDEALTVTYSNCIIQGSWGYTSANVSGWYNTMRECHRYARKRFRYVGMTYEAATACKDAMIAAFTRTFYTSYWNDTAMGGGWSTGAGGTMLMADVSCVHVEADCWEVHVCVNEDDVRYKLATESFVPLLTFAVERLRDYNGETEATQAS